MNPHVVGPRAGGAPQEPETNLIRYWLVLKKRRVTVLLFTAVVMLTVTIGTLVSTRYYAASATIEISPRTPSVIELDEVADMVSATTSEERRIYYNTQYRIIKSRSVLETTVQRLRDEGVTDFNDEEDPVRFLERHLKVDPELDTRLVHVVFEYPNPERAALFANTLAQVYMDLNRERSLSVAKEAFEWLQKQQEAYRERKRTADLEVHNFKYGTDLGLDEQYNAVKLRLGKLQESLSEVHARRVEIEAAYERARAMARAGSWLGLATHYSQRDDVLQGLLENYQALEQERNTLAARYLPDHPKMSRLESELPRLMDQIRVQVEQILAAQQTELSLLADQEEALEAEVGDTKTEVESLDRQFIELNFLQASAEKNEAFFRNLDQRMSEVDLSKFVESNNIWFIDEAIPSDKVVRPRLVMNLPWSLIVGLMGGIVLAFFMEYVDSTVKSREDVEDFLGIPFLGAVPMLPMEEFTALQSELDRNIFVHARPRSPVAEALRSIRTNILFHTEGKPQRRLLVTSAAPREGKSFLSSNLSTIIAMTGSRVLLIDADLRRPTQHKLFKLTNDFGLSTALLGETALADSIQRTHVPNLHVMAAGPRPPNPAELLGSDRMTRLLDAIVEYDIVVVDSSPVTVVADPLIVSRLVDGVVLVIESNRTARDLVLQSRSRLGEMDAKMLGAIVNKLDVRRAGYGYYYYYDYSSTYYYGEGEGDAGRNTG